MFTTNAPRQLVPAHADTLALGALLAIFAQNAANFRELRDYIRLGACCGFIVLVTMFVSRGGLDPHDRVVQTIGFAAISIVFAGFVYEAVTAAPGSVLERLLTNRLLIAFGRYSYVMYLWHIVIGNQVARVFVNQDLVHAPGGLQIFGNLAFAATAIAGTFMFGAISWRFFEAPILTLKDRLPYGTRSGGPKDLAEAPAVGG